MGDHLKALQAAIATARQQVVEHPLYHSIHTLADVRAFTQFHVFAVWDFMSLLKGLQQQLTCTTYPWVPVGHPNTRYLINEIVNGEESDVDAMGNRGSHFELYLQAMEELGADLQPAQQLIAYLQNGIAIREAIRKLELNPAIRDFMHFTFDTLDKQNPAVTAAVFTFGREDLIPDMFIGLVRDLEQRFPGQLGTFRYYLERHIELDGDHHSQLAMAMVQELCGEDAAVWQQATEGARQALVQRRLLWDAALAGIQNQGLTIQK